jgi:hypothetical protein
MTTPDDGAEPTRAELERVAFGRAETPAEVAAAQSALRRLVHSDAAAAAAARAAAQPVAEPEVVDVALVPVGEEPASRPRRRTLIPLLVVVGLFAGAAVGVLATRPEATTTTPGASATTTPTPTPTPNAVLALKSLLAPQTKADKDYPFLVASGHGAIQPASVHRIMTAPDGAVLWVGRSDTGVCMMWSRPDKTDDGIAGASTCAAPAEFDSSGLTLSDGPNSWTWNGIDFTTTLTN